MTNFWLTSSGALLIAAATWSEVRGQSPVARDAKLVKLADGFLFTEGPTADAEGNVYFTDQPNNRIHRWSVDGILSVFLEPAGRANGLCSDLQGSLWACADERNELWRIDLTTKTHQIIVKDYEQKLLNGPNDVWVRPDGGLYFTDPYFKRPYWTRGPSEQDGAYVYFLSHDRKVLKRVTGPIRPNGVVGTPDGRTLYVASGEIRAYDIEADGSLSHERTFCEGPADGLTLDSDGNLYLAARGVAIHDARGRLLDTIEVPERWTANVCFGGRERKTLFITASRGLYAIETRIPGSPQ
jgi:gluconolactonase